MIDEQTRTRMADKLKPVTFCEADIQELTRVALAIAQEKEVDPVDAAEAVADAVRQTVRAKLGESAALPSTPPDAPPAGFAAEATKCAVGFGAALLAIILDWLGFRKEPERKPEDEKRDPHCTDRTGGPVRLSGTADDDIRRHAGPDLDHHRPA